MKTGILKAQDIMTRKVYTVRPADPLWKVIETICTHRVSGVPVVDGKGQLVGLVSERDILYAMHPVAARSPGKRPGRAETKGTRNIDELLARDVMVAKVITGTPDSDALRLASVMALRKIRRIPIVEGKKLVGIVSHGDVCRAIFGRKGGPRCSRQRP
jgi:CBS domain-containing protein